jgi:hypothetical protein
MTPRHVFPSCFKRAAATLESTPPLMAIRIFPIYSAKRAVDR